MNRAKYLIQSCGYAEEDVGREKMEAGTVTLHWICGFYCFHFDILLSSFLL